ncbi:9861_t:CDS:2, partial [Entrophospora sp. SA101]
DYYKITDDDNSDEKVIDELVTTKGGEYIKAISDNKLIVLNRKDSILNLNNKKLIKLPSKITTKVFMEINKMTFLTNGNLLLIEERFNYKDLKIHILTFKSTCDSNNNVHFRAIYKTSYNIISPATINNRPNVFLNSRKMLIDYKDLFTTQIDNVTMTFENHYYLLRPCFIIKKLIYSKDECIVAIKLCHEIVVCSIEYGIVVSSARFKEETIKDIEFIYSKDNVEHLFAILINKQSNEITYKLFDPYDLNNYTCITDIFNGSTAAGDNKNETIHKLYFELDKLRRLKTSNQLDQIDQSRIGCCIVDHLNHLNLILTF